MTYAELYAELEISHNDLIIIKSILDVMRDVDIVKSKKQKLTFASGGMNMLKKAWEFYKVSSAYIDYSHMSKITSHLWFKILTNSLVNDVNITICAIFCPGYEGNGYKTRLGSTTIQKLNNLEMISKTLNSFDIQNNIICAYADVFLENPLTDENIENYLANKNLFFSFAKEKFLEVYDLSSMLAIQNLSAESFIDFELLSQFNPDVYNAFLSCNKNFYKSFNWSQEKIQKRNDELITLYALVAEFLKENNTIYAAIENIRERNYFFESYDLPVIGILK